tara:strand:+ start:189 stop:1778 length:1590 start_codon:yes stop_codon:yes gene_type:complete
MNFKKSLILFTPYIFLAFFSFSINHWTGSRGLFPVDTFVHFDSAVRILKNELPIRDFWIVHGLFVDIIQAFLFKLFGVNWNTYLLHGSIFNVIITIFSYKIFTDFSIKKIHSFVLCLCISILAYPVSGTPFLDLHSAYLSLISMYLVMLFVKNNDYSKLVAAIIILGLAFFCKQVPAAYFIIFTTLFIIYYSFWIKSLKPIKISLLSVIFFLGMILIYLFWSRTNFEDFIMQLFLFPSSFGTERYNDYQLNLNNVFYNFKFIYAALFIMSAAFIINLLKTNFLNQKKEICYFVIIMLFTGSLMFHQIYTKNQIFIFFLIPILIGFFLFFLKNHKIKYKKYLFNLAILFCLVITFKYHIRFNEFRKFHELSYTDLSKGIELKFNNSFFKGLKWITPNFKNPEQEVKIIEKFYNDILKRNDNNIIISRYTFFSGLLNKSVYAPSRTFDNISYPRLNSKYYYVYKNFFRKNIIKNKIDNIFIFYPAFELTEENFNDVIFNYLPNVCYNVLDINDYIKKIQINECNYLKKKYK